MSPEVKSKPLEAPLARPDGKDAMNGGEGGG